MPGSKALIGALKRMREDANGRARQRHIGAILLAVADRTRPGRELALEVRNPALQSLETAPFVLQQ
jgi:hypothetical protein